jgi:hypothetical protein
MPTVLYLRGWRLHFYSNEGNEPRKIILQHFDDIVEAWETTFGERS